MPEAIQVYKDTGSLCEQFIDQHLPYARPSYEEPELFYWCREKRQLKSLHVFMQEKNLIMGLGLMLI